MFIQEHDLFNLAMVGQNLNYKLEIRFLGHGVMDVVEIVHPQY
jgi:hypothetical protein